MTKNDIFRNYIDTVQEKFPLLVEKLQFVLKDKEIIENFPKVVGHYYNNAIGSFLTANFTASIGTISASVEVAINNDMRVQELKNKTDYTWLHLSIPILKKISDLNVPIEKLLIQGDSLEKDKEKVWFIVRRNKFVHGEIHLPTGESQVPALMEKNKKGYLKTIRFSARSETMALQQLMSAHSFLKALYT